ncbi:thioredoxin-like protein [Periconia macrospinosa]|uniref:Thioredoxin-like protein n=1 Tax=Periconia macrospinosa TaxID=97972 RepID=A0A2V1DAY6_9PLEO|nr:thioredoxin-like protein [Periconia macrospinosa]
MSSPILEFNYDISCPFAYIASTRIEALEARTGATLIYRPVLLGAIYRATSAPQGAAGSASDVYNPTKKAVTAKSMQRTLRRYRIEYNPPPQHPRKTVNALRLLHFLDGEDRRVLTKKLFQAYWVEGRDVSDDEELLRIVGESGIKNASALSASTFADATARKGLEDATSDAIQRGAFGVPGFWIPDVEWTDFNGAEQKGRFYWGQDRMHFVEATILALQNGGRWDGVSGLKSLLPRCIPQDRTYGKVRVEFWYDFSSPWAFLGWTQLESMKRKFGPDLEITMKPFLLGILFREIGAPNMPMMAVSPTKAIWSRQDHADWVQYWNSVNIQEGSPDKNIDFHWADVFPIRTPTVLRVALAEPATVSLLYRACWEDNANMSDDAVLTSVLDKAGYDGASLVRQANTPEIKAKLRELTAEAKSVGICGVPTYRVFRENKNGGLGDPGSGIWGQDEINVVEDLIAGWDPDGSNAFAEVRRGASSRL